MTLRELKSALDVISAAGIEDEVEVTVFGVGHGLPLSLNGDWSRPPGEALLLHSFIKRESPHTLAEGGSK